MNELNAATRPSSQKRIEIKRHKKSSINVRGSPLPDGMR